LAPILFAVALIAAGQSSTITGTLAGQIVMEGYLKLRINPLLRRLITRLIAITPAVLTILIYGNEKIDYLLVLSQVILSVQLGFAVIPLIHFVSDKNTMGEFAIKTPTKIAAWLVASILVFLNVKMVIEQTLTLFETDGNWFWKIAIMVLAVIFIWLFIMMTFLPLVRNRKLRDIAKMHDDIPLLQNLTVKETSCIAVALDFTEGDKKLIAYAIAQGKQHVDYVLLHIVESTSARYFGSSSDDYETRKDQERLDDFAKQLQMVGYRVTVVLGYQNRIKEIVRIVKNANADMLVMGAHRHRGLKDYIFGETIESVRHELTIPVLIVNV
jgi:manganese transport protein